MGILIIVICAAYLALMCVHTLITIGKVEEGSKVLLHIISVLIALGTLTSVGLAYVLEHKF